MLTIFIINMVFSIFATLIISFALIELVEDQHTPEGRHVYREWHNGFYGDDTYRDTVKYVTHVKPAIYTKKKKILTIASILMAISAIFSTIIFAIGFMNPITTAIAVSLSLSSYFLTAIDMLKY